MTLQFAEIRQGYEPAVFSVHYFLCEADNSPKPQAVYICALPLSNERFLDRNDSSSFGTRLAPEVFARCHSWRVCFTSQTPCRFWRVSSSVFRISQLRLARRKKATGTQFPALGHCLSWACSGWCKSPTKWMREKRRASALFSGDRCFCDEG